MVFLNGKVTDLTVKSFYQIRFPYEKGHDLRTAFENYSKEQLNKEEFSIDCKITGGAQIQRTNPFTLTTKEINSLN